MKKFLVVCILFLALGKTQAQTSALATLAASMQPGTWAELPGTSMSNWNGGRILSGLEIPNANCTNGDYITQFADKAQWDAARKMLRFMGAAHGNCYGANNVAFADSANAWNVEPFPFSAHCQYAGDTRPGINCSTPFNHAYEHDALNPANGDFYYRWYGSKRVSRLRNGTWTELSDIPMPSFNCCSALEYFPNYGLVFIDTNWGIWKTSDDMTWIQVANTTTNTGSNQPLHPLDVYPWAHYDAVDGILIFGAGTYTYTLSTSGTIASKAAAPINFTPTSNAVTAIDPVTGHLVFLRSSPDVMYEFNPQTNVWTMLNVVIPADMLSYGISTGVVAAPISNYGVIMFVSYKGITPGYSKVWLYKHGASAGPPPTNQPPFVNAGPDQMITLPASALLSGSATDDGLPSGSSLSYTWSGAGITFTNANLATTTASFASAGSYVATLTVGDGQLTGMDTVQITVNSASGGGGGSDVTPPTVPTNLHITATSGNSIELMWNTSTDNVGVTGYKILGNGTQIGTSTHNVFLATNLTPVTTYNFTVKAYDAAGNESVPTTPVTGMTDRLLAFTEKCALAGVLRCRGFDSQDELTYYWPSPSMGGGETRTTCDNDLGAKGYTNHWFDPMAASPANYRATIQDNRCIYGVIDTVFKHSGNGSLRLLIPNHSSADSTGEFAEPFKKYPDGTFGYVGPTTTIPTASAHHEGDDLYVQFNYAVDPVMLDTKFMATDGNQALGWKQFGVYGNPPNTTCCGPATQIFHNLFQSGVPAPYSYDFEHTIVYETSNGMQGIRGCAFVYPGQYDNGTTYKDPPCKRYARKTWQEFDAHLKIRGNPGEHVSLFEAWIDAQKTQEINVFAMTWGTISTANGLGQYNLNAYHTSKDPNQTYPDSYVWYDGVIISTQPIPMGTRTGSVPVPTPPDCVTDPLKFSVSKWPTGTTGSKSMTYSTDRTAIVSFDPTSTPWQATAKDSRPCQVTVKK